jgi:NADPH-dependent 2,4-dienoyl-CoA reductase/sulfur reductase-like enzyme/nitrite reductase/ring-hydroxylating ferredoxin subunit
MIILGRLADFPSGEMREVEVAGHKILLVRQGDDVTAIGAICSHAGGPLVQGVLAEGRVVCPWHKAAFCTRTGKRLDPPAVDDVPAFSVGVQNGEIVLKTPKPVPHVAHESGPADARCFVILGAGAAGFSAAQELRRSGFTGTITLVSQEDALPYDRTVLSKYFLSGQQSGEKTPLQDDEFYVTQNIIRRTAKIISLDPEKKRIGLADGHELLYDAALIATGGAIVPPPFPGSDLGNVFTLRSQADAVRIVQAAAQSRRAVVIGASFIGMEVAAALRERGLDVTVVAEESAPFEHQLGSVIGNVYREIHQEKGVKFRFGTRVEHLAGQGQVQTVMLEGGERLQTDLVIAGLGVRPATTFVKALTRGPDHAVVVDRNMRLGEDLYAAGDIAAFPIYGDNPLIRVEHWRVAEQQGCVAARNMMGVAESFDAVPYFWTIQYMIRLDYVGHASGDDTLVIRGDLGKRKFIVYYLRAGMVAAAAGMDQDKDMAAIIVLMNRRRNWTVDEIHPQGASPYAVLENLCKTML